MYRVLECAVYIVQSINEASEKVETVVCYYQLKESKLRAHQKRVCFIVLCTNTVQCTEGMIT